MITSISFQSPIGSLSILTVKEGVVKISFENESREEMEKWCRNHLNMEIIEGTDVAFQVKDQVLNYLNGRRISLDFPVVHINSPFCTKVLEMERNIPYGQTRSYGEVAKMVNNPRAFRAVGSANSNNPLPLYFPCHRIIYSDKSMGGFGGGVTVKQWLLNLEFRHH